MLRSRKNNTDLPSFSGRFLFARLIRCKKVRFPVGLYVQIKLEAQNPREREKAFYLGFSLFFFLPFFQTKRGEEEKTDDELVKKVVYGIYTRSMKFKYLLVLSQFKLNVSLSLCIFPRRFILLSGAVQHFVDDPPVLRLLRGEVLISVDRFPDQLDVLVAIFSDNFVDLLANR
jgi:hypothetical protein